MSEPLVPKDERIPDKTKLEGIVSRYLSQLYATEKQEGSYMKDQCTRILFNVLLKFSYGLFALGLALSIESKALDQQKFVTYIGQERNQIFLLFIVVFGVADLAILKVVKEDNKVKPATKKKLNAIVDIIRTILYILNIVFIQKFVYDTDNSMLRWAFWLFSINIPLFIWRKVTKWKYFLCTDEGKQILDPWRGKQIQTKENITKFADFTQYMLKQLRLNQDRQSTSEKINPN